MHFAFVVVALFVGSARAAVGSVDCAATFAPPPPPPPIAGPPCLADGLYRGFVGLSPGDHVVAGEIELRVTGTHGELRVATAGGVIERVIDLGAAMVVPHEKKWVLISNALSASTFATFVLFGPRGGGSEEFEEAVRQFESAARLGVNGGVAAAILRL